MNSRQVFKEIKKQADNLVSPSALHVYFHAREYDEHGNKGDAITVNVAVRNEEKILRELSRGIAADIRHFLNTDGRLDITIRVDRIAIYE